MAENSAQFEEQFFELGKVCLACLRVLVVQAVLHSRGHKFESDSVQSALGCRQLRHHLGAIRPLLNEALQATNLTLDAAEADKDIMVNLFRKTHVRILVEVKTHIPPWVHS